MTDPSRKHVFAVAADGKTAVGGKLVVEVYFAFVVIAVAIGYGVADATLHGRRYTVIREIEEHASVFGQNGIGIRIGVLLYVRSRIAAFSERAATVPETLVEVEIVTTLQRCAAVYRRQRGAIGECQQRVIPAKSRLTAEFGVSQGFPLL